MKFSDALFRITSFFSPFGCKKPLFEEIFLNAPTALCLCDRNGTIQYANTMFTQLTGYSENELRGENMSLFKSAKNSLDFFNHFWQELIHKEAFSGNIWNEHKNGQSSLHDVKVTPITLDKMYYLSSHIDVTQELELHERYRYLAYHDPLTGLANRALLEDRLSHAIANASRSGNNIGILLCDLNEFKQINDDMGHIVGDRVLEEVAKRLKSSFRTNDTVARFGGDEFVIIVEHLDDDTQLSRIAEALALKIAEPIDDELNLSVSASIGTATFPQDGLTKEQLFSVADHKMYHNKNRFYGFLS